MRSLQIPHDRIDGTIVSTVVGGTASVLSGGSFENGARTADRYIPILLSLLQQNSDKTAIATALQKIEQNEFGMQSPSPGIAKAATDIWLLRTRKLACPLLPCQA